MLSSVIIAAAGVALGVHMGERRAKGESWKDIGTGMANGVRDSARKTWRWLSGTSERVSRPESPERPDDASAGK